MSGARLGRRGRLALAAACLLITGAAPSRAAAEEPKISVRLVPDPLALDELATLEIQIAGTGFESPKIEPQFELDNLEAVAGPYQAQNFSWVNGRTSSSFQLIWRLRPLAAGPARVKALRLRIEGQEIALADQEVVVVDQAPPGRAGAAAPADTGPADPFDELFDNRRLGRRRAPAQQPKILVRAEVEPANPVVGQQIAYRLVLYTQTDISAFNPLALPDFRGFWAREVTLPDRARPEWVDLDGERFGRVVMLQRALYPLQTGKLTLEPIEVEVVARIAQSGFFGPFGRNVPQRARTLPLVVDVRPLPAPPPGFTGVVGNLSLAARLDRSTTEAGQAATLTLSAESQGNLQGLTPPALALPDGLRAYAPRPESKERVVGGALVSTQTWSYVLVPERAGAFQVPPVTLDYFDPVARRFATAASPPVSLQALAPTTPPAAPTAAAAATASTPSPAPATAVAASLGPALWIGAALAVATLVGLGFALGRRGGGADSEPRRRLLAALEAAASEPARAAAEAFDAAWRAHLAERFTLAADTPSAQLGERLRERGLPAATSAAILALFEEIEYLRQAPELSDVGHLREEIVARSRSLVRQLG